ncbi:hypothetical protein L7F22_053695 [Adiantum nelumboides]|nr:hypothetical protein [Adiantum nelumboides]
MIPLINNVPQQGPATDLPKLVEEAVLPQLILQPLSTVVGIRGLNRVAPYGLHRKPNLVRAEMVSQAKALKNFEFEAERAVPDYGSSGSDHDLTSVSLFAMVHDFIENEGTSVQPNCSSDARGCLDTNKDTSKAEGTEEMSHTLESLVLCADSTEEVLLREIQEILADIVHTCDNGKPATVMHSCLKRTVMSRLQMWGYNAAICKSKWDHLCGIPAGDYEYIDVHLVVDSMQSECSVERLLVDIDFQSQFEIARPSSGFCTTWMLLPPIFVGRVDRLKRIVKIMSEATKQSLREKGLHLPPWRKPAYMKAKWFSSYKRTSSMYPGRPCKGDQQHANAIGFAVRGGGLDVTYTNTLEVWYHDTGSNLLTSEDKEAGLPQREGNQITVVTTDWQPPAVAPRTMVSRKQGIATGLSSLLLQGPTPLCTAMMVQAA